MKNLEEKQIKKEEKEKIERNRQIISQKIILIPKQKDK